MIRVGGKHWKHASILLVVMLLGAHTGALAHAFQHDPGSLQDTTCASCAAASELANACIDNGIAPDIQVLHSCLAAIQQGPIESIATLSARQRGPPE